MGTNYMVKQNFVLQSDTKISPKLTGMHFALIVWAEFGPVVIPRVKLDLDFYIQLFYIIYIYIYTIYIYISKEVWDRISRSLTEMHFNPGN